MGFEDKIAAMVPRYLMRTEDRVSKLRRVLTEAGGGGSAGAIGEVRLALHDIAGTAPVMGLAEVGALARQGDDIAARLAAYDGPIDADALAPLRAIVDRLSEEVLRVRAG